MFFFSQLIQIVNDNTIVVQEYFQQRVEIWLRTVGALVFDIKHHWVRFEFAPGRGQIHAHMLVITGDQRIYQLCHEARKSSDTGERQRSELLAGWAKRVMRLTASVDSDFDDRVVDPLSPPVRVRFTDVPSHPDGLRNDCQDLMKFLQVHECSGFCMRSSKRW